MKKQVEVFFDYICPFCYRGISYLLDVKDNYPNLEFIYRATEVQPDDERKVLDEETIEHLRVFLKDDKMPFNPPYMPMAHTHKAFQAMKYLIDNEGNVDQFHRNVFKSIFVDQENIEDIDTILACAQDCGINLEALKKELIETSNESSRKNDLNYAYQTNKVDFVPTLIHQDQRLDAIEAVGYTKKDLIAYLDSLNG